MLRRLLVIFLVVFTVYYALAFSDTFLGIIKQLGEPAGVGVEKYGSYLVYVGTAAMGYIVAVVVAAFIALKRR